METPSLVKKLNKYGISLRVENGALACDSGTPIPKSIGLTISTHERKLLSYLKSNEPADKDTYQPTSVYESYSSNEVVQEVDNLENYARGRNLHLPPVLLYNLMAWVAKFHELRISHPDGITINATPEHVRDAAKLQPWGVVYDPERYLLLSWGDVPTVTLLGLRDLETGELLIPEQVAA